MSGKYKKLVGNTLIFAIGSFASKAMVFLLMPLYTSVLTDAQYGAADIMTTTSNLITPFIMLSINEAIIRFGMDKSLRKKEVFSVGVRTVFQGFFLFLLLLPLMLKIDLISNYTLWIYLYVFAAALKNVVAQFVRSMGCVKLYAFDGFLATFTTIAFNLLFMVYFKFGSVGYVLSIIASNVVSILFLFIIAKLDRYIDIININKPLRRQMLKYSVPLIPTTMFWWITLASDRFVIAYFWGEGATGLYSAAHKLPALLTLVSAVFYQAWQISAVTEADEEDRFSFYSEVFDYYTTLLFIAASGLIMVCKPVISFWLAESFFESWQFVPFLTIAEVFSTIVTFLGSFYMVSKKNSTVVIAVAVGAIANLCLNFYLVPIYGPLSAAFATVVSYLLAFLVRGIDVLRFVKINLRPLPILTYFILLMAQSYLLLIPDLKSPMLIQLAMFFLMLLFNVLPISRLCKALFSRFLK